MGAIDSLSPIYCVDRLPGFCFHVTGQRPLLDLGYYPIVQGPAVTCGMAPLFANYETLGSNAPVSSRRQGLLARAPSRQRIAALMSRLPSCDEWLDDKYDQKS